MGRAARIRKQAQPRPEPCGAPLDVYAEALDALRGGNRAAAIVLLRQVVLQRPDHALAHFNLATALREQADLSGAILHYKGVLRLQPLNVDGLVNLAETLRRSKRPAEALTLCERALAIAPRHAEGLMIRGVVRHELGDLAGSVDDLRAASAENPRNPNAAKLLGTILLSTPRQAEALATLREARAVAPDDPEIHRMIGDLCDQLGHTSEGFVAYRRAIELDPLNPIPYANLTGLLCRTKLLDVALSVSAVGIKIAPDVAQLHFNRAIALEKMGRVAEALSSYGEALRCEPGSGRALTSICRLRRQTCDWDGLAAADGLSRTLTYRKNVLTPPFAFLTFTTSLAEVLACNRPWSRALEKGVTPLASYEPRPVARRGERVRVGYLSADFHMHATAALIAELFELQDRSRLESWGYSIGAHDAGPMRQRLVAALDHFHDLTDLSHDDAAALIRSHDIDILIDLKGYTFQARPEILARRPAPIQVAFLGYPATMGARFIDYVIGDRIVTPAEHAPFYTEAIVQLPHSYQPNDGKRPIASDGQSRAGCGLPDEGFVFCCFNAAHKITPEVFAIWMRLLEGIAGSVLWLYAVDPIVHANLRREAETRGIEPDRLVFAPKLPVPYHLARMRHADLFLDTAPYGAHTTASEALWAGLPVLTVCGEVFAARVASSLLSALDMPELVAGDWDAYEATALELGRHPDVTRALKSKLARNRATHPLFDARLFARGFDAALMRMAAMRDAGEVPRGFAVDLASDGRVETPSVSRPC